MAEPAATLLDVAARAPAAAALVAGALSTDERKALRLAHPALHDAVAEVVVKLKLTKSGSRAPRSEVPLTRLPTPRRWHALRELELPGPELLIECLRALGAEPWPRLQALQVGDVAIDIGFVMSDDDRFGMPATRALAAAAPRLPALAKLVILGFALSAAELAELFSVEWRALECLDLEVEPDNEDNEDEAEAGGAEPAAGRALQPRLRDLTMFSTPFLPPAMARWAATRGWPLEGLSFDFKDSESLAALVAAPTFALRRLQACGHVDETDILALAAAPWPLEDLRIQMFHRYDGDRHALAALARHARLRSLYVGFDGESSAAVRALAGAAWPELTSFSVEVEHGSRTDLDTDSDEDGEPLDGAAFALCPKLEVLHLSGVEVRAAGAIALARRPLPRLRDLSLRNALLDNLAVAGLLLGPMLAWPALVRLNFQSNPGILAPPALADVQRWAPAVTSLEFGQE